MNSFSELKQISEFFAFTHLQPLIGILIHDPSWNFAFFQAKHIFRNFTQILKK